MNAGGRALHDDSVILASDIDMALDTVPCPVIGVHVSRITNLEGEVTRLICSEYEESTGICRLKRNSSRGGPLAQFLERESEDTLDTRTERCHLGPH